MPGAAADADAAAAPAAATAQSVPPETLALFYDLASVDEVRRKGGRRGKGMGRRAPPPDG